MQVESSLHELMQKIGNGMYEPLGMSYIAAALTACTNIPQVAAKIWGNRLMKYLPNAISSRWLNLLKNNQPTAKQDALDVINFVYDSIWGKMAQSNQKRDPH